MTTTSPVAFLSEAMEGTLRAAAASTLVAQPNHPSIRVLEKRGYLRRIEEVERRAGRYVQFRWGLTESGRVRLASLTVEMTR